MKALMATVARRARVKAGEVPGHMRQEGAVVGQVRQVGKMRQQVLPRLALMAEALVAEVKVLASRDLPASPQHRRRQGFLRVQF